MTEPDCRCIYRAGVEPMPLTRVAPNPDHPVGAEQRAQMADFLYSQLMKPLHHTPQQHRLSVEKALNTMTLPERIAIEIEMTERAKVMHSYDYDALR